MSQQQTPTREQVRDARHTAFRQSLSPVLPEERYSRVAQSYAIQDARRERNVDGFVRNVTGR